MATPSPGKLAAAWALLKLWYARHQVLPISWILHGRIRKSGELPDDRHPCHPSIPGNRSYIRGSMLDIVEQTAQGGDMACRRPSPRRTIGCGNRSLGFPRGLFCEESKSRKFPFDNQRLVRCRREE